MYQNRIQNTSMRNFYLIIIQVICHFKIQNYILYKLILSHFSSLAGLCLEMSLSLLCEKKCLCVAAATEKCMLSGLLYSAINCLEISDCILITYLYPGENLHQTPKQLLSSGYWLRGTQMKMKQ